jgi:hypothetical protein
MLMQLELVFWMVVCVVSCHNCILKVRMYLKWQLLLHQLLVEFYDSIYTERYLQTPQKRFWL